MKVTGILMLVLATGVLPGCGATEEGELAPVSASAPAPGPASQAASTAEETVNELIRQLGSDSFKVREEATRKLADLGPAIRPLLEAKLKEKDLDPEVAARISSVLGDRPARPDVGLLTDTVTGITVSIDADGKVVGTREGKIVWKMSLSQPVTGLIMEAGRVIVLPSGMVIEPGTGRGLEKLRLRPPSPSP